MVQDGGLHLIDPLSLACPSTAKSFQSEFWKAETNTWLTFEVNSPKPIDPKLWFWIWFCFFLTFDFGISIFYFGCWSLDLNFLCWSCGSIKPENRKKHVADSRSYSGEYSLRKRVGPIYIHLLGFTVSLDFIRSESVIRRFGLWLYRGHLCRGLGALFYDYHMLRLTLVVNSKGDFNMNVCHRYALKRL